MKPEQITKSADILDDYLSGKSQDTSALSSVISLMREIDQPNYDKLLALLADEYKNLCGILYHRKRMEEDADKRQIKINFD